MVPQWFTLENGIDVSSSLIFASGLLKNLGHFSRKWNVLNAGVSSPLSVASHSKKFLKNFYQQGTTRFGSRVTMSLVRPPQETLLDRWRHHQHRQHRRQQPQRPLHQPERPHRSVTEAGRIPGLGCGTERILVAVGCCVNPLCFFQASLLTLTRSSCTGSAQATAPLTAVSWTAPAWRCSTE